MSGRYGSTGIQKKWSSLTVLMAAIAPPTFGVYEIGNRVRNVIYIGHGSIKDRLQAHLSPRGGNPCIKAKGMYVRWEETGRKDRAQQRENALLDTYRLNHGCLPECNGAPARRRRQG